MCHIVAGGGSDDDQSLRPRQAYGQWWFFKVVHDFEGWSGDWSSKETLLVGGGGDMIQHLACHKIKD